MRKSGRCFVAVVDIEADGLTSCSNRGGRSPTKGNSGKTVRWRRAGNKQSPDDAVSQIKLFSVKDYMVGLSYLCLSFSASDTNLFVSFAMDCVQLNENKLRRWPSQFRILAKDRPAFCAQTVSRRCSITNKIVSRETSLLTKFNKQSSDNAAINWVKSDWCLRCWSLFSLSA